MISLSVTPLHEIEAAHELAETLLQDHKDIMTAGLSALLSSFRSDLSVMIDDHYGIPGDAEPGRA